MATNFTVTITTVIEGETHTFERTLPLNNELARKVVGTEISMILEEHYSIYKSANLIMREKTNEE